YHVDPQAGKETPYGGLIASGWHTGCVMMRLMCDAYLNESSCIGSPGIDEWRFALPVRPGDTLRYRATVLEARTSASKPDRGIVKWRWELLNQRDEVVVSQVGTPFFLRRRVTTGPGRSESHGDVAVLRRAASLRDQPRTLRTGAQVARAAARAARAVRAIGRLGDLHPADRHHRRPGARRAALSRRRAVHLRGVPRPGPRGRRRDARDPHARRRIQGQQHESRAARDGRAAIRDNAADLATRTTD